MSMRWLHLFAFLAAATAVVLAPTGVNGECTPTYTGGSIVVTGGTLNGASVNPSDLRIAVQPGEALTGTVDITVENNGAPGNVFPVCATPNWGDHATGGWSITGHSAPGTSNYSVSIDETAPSVPGTYYMFFVGSWELTCGNVLSCTNWNNGTGDLWNNGHDVADWTPDQAQDAMSQGWVCTGWMTGGVLTEWNIPAAALELEVAYGSCDPATAGGGIAVTGGTVDGQLVDPADPKIHVLTGIPFSGSVNIRVQNNGAPGNVFPVCATPNWGTHESSGWSVTGNSSPGTADYTVSISETAPEPGTYYIFFVGSWELDCDNVLSCTNWNNGTGDLWNNGHDVADWTPDQAENARHWGWVCSDWMTWGELHQWAIPAAALEIEVGAVVPAVPTTWGRLKARYAPNSD